jgi:UDP-N-acetylmuramoyl-L-alanyl-D-glutamate--2,6-diaminopimelate ligase
VPTLADLLFGMAPVEVTGLSWDSRRVRPGDLFFALPGTRADGHAFIGDAIVRGAAAVVGERPLVKLPVPYALVPDARAALAQAACAFYDHPTRRIPTIAVTGTNGKTTVVHLLGQLLPACEALTTVRVEREGLSCVTTPEAPDLQRLAARAVGGGRKFFAFEASSIGLAQHRVDGVHLAAAVFTNLGRDHLDFHRTHETYLAAKLRLFAMLPPGGIAVVNAEDLHGARFLAVSRGRPVRYGIGHGDVRAEGLRPTPDGAEFRLVTPDGSADVRLPFPGVHNVRNALAAAATAWALGEPVDALAERLSRAELPPGRFQRLRTAGGAQAVVDYAHTPEALAQMVATLRPTARRLIVVFGASGEADRGKRPLMGEAVGRRADLAVITADNPKSEDPGKIAEAVAHGVRAAGGRYVVVLDRRQAIRRAVEEAGPGDVVLIAGKGHERYQLTADGPVPYSDLEVLLSEHSAALERA